MGANAPEDIAAWFAGLVRDDLITAFCTLLAAGRVPKEQAADVVGGPEALQDLCDLGMAQVMASTPSSPAAYEAAPVPLAMQAVLTDLQDKVLQQQKILLDGQRRLSNAQALPGDGPDNFPEHQLRYITDREEIVRVSSTLINSAHRDFMTLETALTDLPVSDDNRIRCPVGMKGKLRARSIYDGATLKEPAAMENLQQCIADGEEVRILPVIPAKMQLADQTAVLLPATPTGTGGALLIKLAPITRMMRVFFEMMWARAMPFGSPAASDDCPLTELQLRILSLMANDASDVAIAHAVGKSPSTVSRNIEAMKEITSTESRFALGVKVVRHGWFIPEKEKDA